MPTRRLSTPVAAFACDENSTGAIGAVRVHPNGFNLEISQEPLTFVSVIRTLLGVFRGSRLSLLVVVSLRNTSTTAEGGCSSDSAARITVAVWVKCFSLTVGMTTFLVNLS